MLSKITTIYANDGRTIEIGYTGPGGSVCQFITAPAEEGFPKTTICVLTNKAQTKALIAQLKTMLEILGD